MSPRAPLPSVLPILDPDVLTRPVATVLAELAAGGASWVEYRDKRASDRDFLAAAERALAIAREHELVLLLNDRVDVALALGCGVHLGQEDLPPGVARRLLGPEAIIGLSTDRLEDVVAAADAPVSYLAVGPVYATSSKPDAGPAVGLERVAAARDRCAVPLVAIGGIDVDNAAAVTAAGADCVAVLSDLMLAPDIAERMRRLREAAGQGLARRGV